MKYVEKYTGEKTYMFPNGHIATPEVVLQQFPAALVFPHIVETDESGQVLFAIQNLAAMRTIHDIDAALSEMDAIDAVEIAINTPPIYEPSAEERIAAAMEFQNLMML
jgi:hypothetical protein